MHNVLICNVLGFMLKEIKTQHFEKLDTPVRAVINTFSLIYFRPDLVGRLHFCR